MVDNPYQVLGLGNEASSEEVKTAYRRLAWRYHPDQNPDDPKAEATFKEVANAYEILRDPAKRRAYHRYSASRGAGVGAPDAESLGDLLDILTSMFVGKKSKKRTKGRDYQITVAITFLEAHQGVKRAIEAPHKQMCSQCGGSRNQPGSKTECCDLCSGTGRQTKTRGIFGRTEGCSACFGTGKRAVQPCDACSGQGTISVMEPLEINVPPGVRQGQKLVWKGKGEKARSRAASGDLVVAVEVKGHPLFERSGDHVTCAIPVNIAQAALGAKIEVPTLTGKVHMRVPEGTQSGCVFRLPEKGFQVQGADRRGDQLVTLCVETPVGMTPRQREILEEFGRITGTVNHPDRRGFLARMKRLFL
jgi:molecular chaperone DnaJ